MKGDDHMVIKTKDYLALRKCQKSADFKEMEPESKRYLLLGSFFYELSTLIAKESGNEKLTKGLSASLRLKADIIFRKMLDSYDPSWFSTPWQLQERIRLDLILFNRFMDFLMPFLLNAYIKAAPEIAVTYPMDDNNPVTLKDRAHLVIKKDKTIYVLKFHPGKTKKGLRGKSPITRLDLDLEPAVLKCGYDLLVKEKVTVAPVYFQTGETQGMISPFCVDLKGSVKSNIFFLDYDKKTAEEILNDAFGVLNTLKTGDCDNCIYAKYCLPQTFSLRRTIKEEIKDWVLPSFDPSQESVVNFKDKKLLVCAGPGSGKTATLIGRCLSLKTEVSTKQMLLITFTEKAASEILLRLKNYVEEDELPRVCTLNALGMEIIDAYDEISKGKKHILLTDAGRKRIVRNVLDKIGSPLTGISYNVYLGSRFSTIDTVANIILKIKENADAVFNDPDCKYVKKEWDEVIKGYDREISENEYISFDDQIKLATKFLSEPTIRKMFDLKYRYVMVDEYQDINDDQEAFIRSLCLNNGNLLCIGDANQSIYSFRGASSRHLTSFKKTFPDAKIAYLNGNYRSTKEITSFCNKIMPNKNDKPMECAISLKGESVKFVKDNSIKTLEEILTYEHKKGISYKDMAIIATKHKYLKMLNKDLNLPTQLSETLLSNDFLFNVIFYLLSIVYKDDKSENNYLMLGHLFEKDLSWQRSVKDCLKGKSAPEDDDVFTLISYARAIKDESASHFVGWISSFLDMDNTVSKNTLSDLIARGNLDKMEDFYTFLDDCVTYGDNSKIQYVPEDKISLITAHASKGKEYKLVIIYDANSYEDNTANCISDNSYDKNLFFVAASRAMRVLYIAKEKGTTCILEKPA